jgi:hypothetical protein
MVVGTQKMQEPGDLREVQGCGWVADLRGEAVKGLTRPGQRERQRAGRRGR